MSSQKFSNGLNPYAASSPIDLDCVRDTLRYIESDLRTSPEHTKLGTILAMALAEISRIETTIKKTNTALPDAARFVPLRR